MFVSGQIRRLIPFPVPGGIDAASQASPMIVRFIPIAVSHADRRGSDRSLDGEGAAVYQTKDIMRSKDWRDRRNADL